MFLERRFTSSSLTCCNALSRNMAQVEVFILQINFPSLYLPGQCNVKIGQVHMVGLQDEATIVGVRCGLGCAYEWMRLDENFKSTHDLAA